MPGNTKTVTVKFIGDKSNLDSTLQGVGQKAQRAGKGLTRGVTLPALAAGGALVAMGVKAGENADRILDASAQTGVATDKLQEYEFVATQAGVSQDFFEKATEEVVKVMDRVEKGTGPAAEALAELGVETKDANGEMRNAGEITDDAIAALAAVENPTKRASLAQDIFKRSNQDLLPVIDQGVDAINEQREAAHELGVVQSKEALDGANKFRAGMDSLKAQLGGVVATLGGEFAPILSDTVVPLIQEHVVPAIRNVAEFLKGLFDRFQSLPGPIQGMIGSVGGLAVAIGPLLIVGGKLIGAFGAIGKAFKALSLLVSANPWVLLIAATVALVVLIVKNWDKIWGFLKDIWEKITDAVSAVGAWFKDRFDDAVQFVKDLFFNFTPLGLLLKHFDTIKEAVTSVKDWFVDRWNDIISFLTGIPRRIGDAVSGLWDGIKDAFKSAINWVIDKWNNFGFSAGFNIPSLFGGGRVEIGFETPNIPRLHVGGVFQPPPGQSEGLALLRRGEVVSAGAAQLHFHIGTLVGVDDFEEFVVGSLTRARRRGVQV